MKTAICVLAITAGVARADTFYEYGPSTPFGPVEQLAIAACDIDLRGAIADVTLCSASSTHGGARMGNDPKRSVLNRYNQCWDCENVFVTDGACFPYAPFTNPTLTIMALTVRTCDYILREDSRLNRPRFGGHLG